jgi:hypothetical protein
MKIMTSVFLCFFFSIFGISQTLPNYSGEWTLNLAQSKTSDKMPFPAMSKNIDQSDNKIEVLNDSVIKKVFPESKVGITVYSLDGSPQTSSFESGSSELQNTIQAKINAENKLEVLKSQRRIQNGSVQSETLTNELWELLDEGKTLKIISTVKAANQEYSFELSYVKSSSGSIADLTSPEAVKKRQKGDGIINGKALRLITPPYTPEARKANVQGNVFVAVLIDEKGNVVLAKTIAGNQLLTSVSEQAALLCKFSPTKINGKPTIITGIIVYNFLRN